MGMGFVGCGVLGEKGIGGKDCEGWVEMVEMVEMVIWGDGYEREGMKRLGRVD